MSPYDTIFYTSFAVVTLSLTLYFTLVMRIKPSSETKLQTYMRQTSQKTLPKKKQKTPKPRTPAELTEPAEPSEKKGAVVKECSHYLGYLATLPKGTPFPEECFGCRKVIQCLRVVPTKAIDSFYLATPEAKSF